MLTLFIATLATASDINVTIDLSIKCVNNYRLLKSTVVCNCIRMIYSMKIIAWVLMSLVLLDDVQGRTLQLNV